MRALPEGSSKGHSRCGVFGVALNAPKADEAPSWMRGEQLWAWGMPSPVGISDRPDCPADDRCRPR